MSSGEFSVYVWMHDGTYFCELQHVDAETAVNKAKSMSEGVVAKVKMLTKIMITDGGDCSVFEWENGKGVTHGT